MDADLQVTWQFFISAPIPDPLDQPCPDEEGERVRSAVTQWLEQGPACGRVLGSVCIGKGFVTKLYEYVYTVDRQIGDRVVPIGAFSEMISLYEPDTSYLRRMLSVYGPCPTGDCALLSPGFFQTVGPTAEIDVFSFDDSGRPLTDLLVKGQIPYDRSLYDRRCRPLSGRGWKRHWKNAGLKLRWLRTQDCDHFCMH